MVYINFINTGLDDRIIKGMFSHSGSHPAKTEKMVLVHDSKKGDYYRKQLVNSDQPATNGTHSEHEKLFQQAKELGITAKDLKSAEFIQGCLTKPTKRTRIVSSGRGNIEDATQGDKVTNSQCTLKSVDSKTFNKLKQFVIDNYNSKFNKFNDIFKINGIYEIQRLKSEADFQQIKKENAKYKNVTGYGKNYQSDLFFHGTSYYSLLSILGKSGGFRSAASVGRGTNATTDSSYSLDYAVGHFDYSDRNGPLLICEGSVGQTEDGGNNTGSRPTEDNSDKTFTGWTGMINYFVFRKENSLIPRYVVDVERLKTK